MGSDLRMPYIWLCRKLVQQLPKPMTLKKGQENDHLYIWAKSLGAKSGLHSDERVSDVSEEGLVDDQTSTCAESADGTDAEGDSDS